MGNYFLDSVDIQYTECPKIYCKSVLHLRIVQICVILKQMQYRFAEILGHSVHWVKTSWTYSTQQSYNIILTFLLKNIQKEKSDWDPFSTPLGNQIQIRTMHMSYIQIGRWQNTLMQYQILILLFCRSKVSKQRMKRNQKYKCLNR